MAQENGTRKKGTFGDVRLAVSKKYIFPDRRKAMMVIGGLGCLGLLAFFLVDFFFLKSMTTSGPLSSNHATFEKDCSKCHQQLEAVTDRKCAVCHEKTANENLKVYTFAAHYIYRSGTWSRKNSLANAAPYPCHLCHQEHLGRQAIITEVPDSRCTNCHVYGTFNNNHPEFEFALKKIPDDSTLLFTHIRHVKEVVQREKLDDVERACLYCHNPRPDGKNFALVAFDLHCDACHLTTSQDTGPLKLKDPNDPYAPGVETLESIRRRRGPGTTWAYYMNPNEFTLRAGGTKIVKSPVYHKDPWIVENLKRIRRVLYPNPDLIDLLKTTGPISWKNTKSPLAKNAPYQEALQTLQDYAMGLRGRPEPEIQMELAKIDSLLEMAQAQLRRQPNLALDDRFLWAAPQLNPDLRPAQVEDLKIFVDDLTKRCQECHIVANASIARVQKDQRVLNRAEFDHRAHILERRCLEYHVEIPIVAKRGDTTAVKKSKDRAAIQNIPTSANCRECHNASESSNRCVTCHYFHPNKTNRASLLLYLD
jgi:hypothetical protein